MDTMNTQLLLVLLAASASLNVLVLIIFIRCCWLNFIEELNDKFLNTGTPPQPAGNKDLSDRIQLPQEKVLKFQNSGSSAEVLEFFYQDHDALWNNRQN